MEFNIKQKKHHNIPKYIDDDYRLALKFSENIHKELGEFLKAVVLFGSAGRNEKTLYEKDIDVMIVVNDLTVVISQEVIEAYRIITEKVASSVSRRLHITTMKMTAFWDYMKAGDPIAINILRDGVPLYDTGFFEPMQVLLFQGRIRPTEESIWVYFTRAPTTLVNSRWHLLQATLDLYWAVIDSAHAALMRMGEIPPSPSKVAGLINDKMVKKGIVSRKYANTMHFFYELSKKITHRQLQNVTGPQYERYFKEANEFVSAMQKVIENRHIK